MEFDALILFCGLVHPYISQCWDYKCHEEDRRSSRTITLDLSAQPGKFVIAVDVLDVVEVNEVLDVAEELLLVDRQLLTHSSQQSLHQDALHLNGGKYCIK